MNQNGTTKEITIDPSKRSCIQECARKFFYSYKVNVVPKWEPDYFVAGRAWDQAVNIIDCAHDKDLAERWNLAVGKIYQTFGEAKMRKCDPAREPDNLILLLEKYVDRFYEGEVPFTVLDHNVPFQVPHPSLLFKMGGETDAILSWPPYGIVVKEHKTTKLVVGAKTAWDNYLAGFQLGQYADQTTHYAWAVGQLTEQKVWGTVVTISSLAIPKRASTVRDQFQRIWLEKPQQKIDDYLDACFHAYRKISLCEERDEWPKEGSKCTGAWGTMPCEYRHLCTLNIPLENILQGEIPDHLYVWGDDVEEWAPWNGKKHRRLWVPEEKSLTGEGTTFTIPTY